MRPKVSTSLGSSPMAARTRSLLEAPSVPTLLRLAAPNIAVMAIQARHTSRGVLHRLAEIQRTSLGSLWSILSSC